jgi:hypothetical protein
MDSCLSLIIGVVVVVLVLAANVAWISHRLSRPQSLLAEWAERNRLEILYSERQLLFLGWFFQTTFTGQVVYKVRVRDHHRKNRAGLVTCGGPFAPFLMDEAKVRWDNGET